MLLEMLARTYRIIMVPLMRRPARLLLFLFLSAGCVHNNPAIDSPVDIWLTTPDQSKLLSREPDLRFAFGSGAGSEIDVDDSRQYQQIVGFGAAITDASAYLIGKLPATTRDSLMRELFDPLTGIGLSFTRLTIGASDFSRSHYSLDDIPVGETDVALTRFSIDSNRTAVLPVVKQALSINPDIKVMASPWSAPGWMKTTNGLIKGTLRPEAFAPFAEYFKRYIEAFGSEGVPIYAITVQNEPHYEPENYPGMSLAPAQRAKFVGENLGPLFAKSGIRTKILDLDHNWDLHQSPIAERRWPTRLLPMSGECCVLRTRRGASIDGVVFT